MGVGRFRNPTDPNTVDTASSAELLPGGDLWVAAVVLPSSSMTWSCVADRKTTDDEEPRTISKGNLCDVLAAVERVIETFRADEAMVMHCCLVLGNMTEVASFVRWFHTAP